jgi:hypothetical protein
MKVVIDDTSFPPRKHFIDVDDKFTNFKPQVRVLPANYFEEPNLLFTLKAIYQPDENKHYPKGGIEVYHSEGALYSYYLDEVIVHPFELGMRKFFTKSEDEVKEKVFDGVKGKRGRPAKDPSELKVKKEYITTGGQRGRKRLSDEERAKREAMIAEKKKNSTGKKGRPKKQVS